MITHCFKCSNPLSKLSSASSNLTCHECFGKTKSYRAFISYVNFFNNEWTGFKLEYLNYRLDYYSELSAKYPNSIKICNEKEYGDLLLLISFSLEDALKLLNKSEDELDEFVKTHLIFS
jgi:hypothetical protein